MSSKMSTTLRIDPRLKREIQVIAKENGLSFSQIAAIALQAIADGFMHISIGVSRYPKEYLEELDRESEEFLRLYRAGKIKKTTAKELFDDILER